MAKYNLNKKRGVKVILLILGLSFIVAPLVMFIVHLLFILG